jgi:hypothetical protein
MMLALLGQLLGCVGSEPDYVVDWNTSGTAGRCVSTKIESVRQTGISSPSINGPNTRASARTADGKTVRWEYMRSLQQDKQLREGDEVFLLLDASGGATGMARSCPMGLGRDVPEDNHP